MASELSIPSAAGRSKIALKPGRSLMDWIRLTHSGRDLTSVGGRCLEVSPRELARHNSRKDAWISLRGRVYNITHYLEYHPGGEDELMRGAGKDATDLFNEIHKWVNAESMLEKCFVGYLKKTWTFDVPKLPNIKNLKFKIKPTVNSLNIPVTSTDAFSKTEVLLSNGASSELEATELANKSLPVPEIVANKSKKSEWPLLSPIDKTSSEDDIRFEVTENSIKLIIKNLSEKFQSGIVDLVERKCFVKISNDSTSIFIIEFPVAVKEDFKVNLEDEQAVVITFEIHDKISNDSESTPLLQRIHWTKWESKDELVYWQCKLVSKEEVNHNTFLFQFELPPGTRMWVPIGHHVQIKSLVEDMEIIRSYTPVKRIPTSSDDSEKDDGNTLSLMVKVYPKGVVTSIINKCSIGESLQISNSVGSFSEEFLKNCDSITMLAAGTGITPMIKIINWIMKASDKTQSVLLLFFNKTENDILWRQQFQLWSSEYPKFQVMNILSEPDERWTGCSGQINEELVKKFVKVQSVEIMHKVLVCGPLQFAETSIKYLNGAGFTENQIHVFTGK